MKLFSIVIICLGLAAGIMVTNSAESAEGSKAEEKVKAEEKGKVEIKSSLQKEIMGEVSGIGINYIAIVTMRDTAKGEEADMLFPVEGGTIALEGVSNLKQIKSGDTVKVGYDEETQIDEAGNETVKRKAKTIKFIRPAPSELRSGM